MSDNMLNSEILKSEKLELGEKIKTAQKKAQFIRDIKGDLGEAIKKNPGKAKILKKSFGERLMIRIKNIFTKF